MAKLSTDDYKITVNGTDFSDHLVGASIPLEKTAYPVQAFGMDWEEQIMSTIKRGSVTLSFHQDYGASSVHSVLWPLFTGSGYATVVATPTSSSVSATNPAFTAVCAPIQYTPIGGNFGGVATLDVTWPTHGTVSQGTAS